MQGPGRRCDFERGAQARTIPNPVTNLVRPTQFEENDKIHPSE